MNRITAFGLTMLLWVCCGVSAQTTYAPLQPDPSWGNNGVATLGVPDKGDYSPGQVRVQPDGKVIVFADRLVRFNTDGSVDLQFGDRGEAVVPDGQLSDQSDIDGGYTLTTPISLNTIRIYRVASNGTLDATFGSSKGYFELNDRTIARSVRKLFAREGGGWIGFAENEFNIVVVRLTSRGTPDTQFAPDGLRLYPKPDALKPMVLGSIGTEITRSPDGAFSILWKNQGGLNAPPYGYALTRFDRDGNLDTRFGGDGVLTGAEIRGPNEFAVGIDALSNNTLQLQGYENGIIPSIWRLVDGRLDTSLGEGGFVRDTAANAGCALSLLFVNELDYAITPAQSFQLCRNGVAVSSAVLPPRGTAGVTPRFEGRALHPIRSGAGANAVTIGFYAIGTVGEDLICTRFNCVPVGRSLYVTKLTASGGIDTAFGGNKGYVEWESFATVLSRETTFDVLPRADGKVLVSGFSTIVKDVFASSGARGQNDVFYGLTNVGQFDDSFAPGGRLVVPLRPELRIYRLAGSSTVWRSDGVGAKITTQGAKVVQAVLPKAGAPWNEEVAEFVPRSDGRTWVRSRAFYTTTTPNGSSELVQSQEIALIDDDGNAVSNGVAGQPLVLFPQDGSAPDRIAAFPDNGLLLVSTKPDKPIVLTRWDASGRFDPSWGSGGLLEVNVTPKGATPGSVNYDQANARAFVLPNGDIWLAVYRYSVDPRIEVTEGGLALVYISDRGRTVAQFSRPGTLWPTKLRPDGRIVVRARLGVSDDTELISIDRQGNAKSDFLRSAFITDFAYQADGKLMTVRGGEVVRYSNTSAASPAPAARTVTEFYNTALNHYFMTANEGEKTFIDSGGAGAGWVRTKVEFATWDRVWTNAGATGVVPTKPVYRFYGTPGVGPNSHFYTVQEAENQIVRKDPGWKFEEIVFYAVEPTANKTCPDSTTPVYRVYNNRFAQNDSNHRYMLSRTVEAEMVAKGWVAEGVVLCVNLVP